MAAPMVSAGVLEMAAKCRQDLDLWKNLVIEGEAVGMNRRDLRDLLMEFGCPGTTATELTAEERANEVWDAVYASASEEQQAPYFSVDWDEYEDPL